MTNNKLTKKSKWLKLALISTATISTLATIPAAICAKAAVKTSTPTASTELGASYIRINFNIRKADGGKPEELEVPNPATLTGPTIVKMMKGGYFGTAQKPTADRKGYLFKGWSLNPDYPANDQEETLLNDGDTITETGTPIYAVFEKIKMNLNFPVSSEGDYQWTYEGGSSTEGVVVPFNKYLDIDRTVSTKFGDVSAPTPKWKVPVGSGNVKAWDGKWYNAPQTSDSRIQITADTVLASYDGKNIYPGWKDVEYHNIVVTGDKVVSRNEINIAYKATLFPEGTTQNVDWYVNDGVTIPADKDGKKHIPSSAHATINKETGVVETTNSKGNFYVFALAKGSTVPASLDTSKSNVVLVESIDPEQDAAFANKIITTFEDADHAGKYLSYAMDPEQFYSIGGVDAQVVGTRLGSNQEDNICAKNEFNMPIAFGKNITNIKDGFMPSDKDANGEPIGFAEFDSQIEMNKVTNIGSDFLLNNPTFNTKVVIPASVHSIGAKFLSGLTLFNQSIEFASDTKIRDIGQKFLQGSKKFAQKFTIPSTVKHIGQYFLYNCTGMNDQTVAVNCQIEAFEDSDASFAVDNNEQKSVVHSIKVECFNTDEYKKLIYAFAEESGDLVRNLVEATIPWTNHLACISDNDGYHFIDELEQSGICHKFDSPIITSDGKSYPREEFNERLYLSPNLASFTTIPEYFLFNCAKFNQPLTIPASIRSIGNQFLSCCYSFKHSLVIPDTITAADSVGGYFMYNCTSFAFSANAQLVVNCAATCFTNSTDTVATNDNNAESYRSGVWVVGTHAADFASRFPDRSQSSFRRIHLG